MSDDMPLHIEKSDDGTFFARYDACILRTAFQPIFRFDKDHLVPIACEALLRVTRDGIPVLTDAFFGSLDSDALRALEPRLRHLHIRNARHLPADQRRLFLNFDPRVPEDPARLEIELRDLGAELRDAGISPSDVVCEITEAETQSDAALKHFAYELRARGYHVAVDDFGAHASRPQRVAALTPDIVKFDGSLVKRLLGTDAGVGTLRVMIAQFRRDGIQCVLEGLEALWEVGIAETTGATMLQGYVLAAPRLAGPDLAAWMTQYMPQPKPASGGERLVKTFR